MTTGDVVYSLRFSLIKTLTRFFCSNSILRHCDLHDYHGLTALVKCLWIKVLIHLMRCLKSLLLDLCRDLLFQIVCSNNHIKYLHSNIWTWWDSLLHINKINLWFAYFLFTSINFYYISYKLFMCNVDTMYTNILLVVFIQSFLSFLWLCMDCGSAINV